MHLLMFESLSFLNPEIICYQLGTQVLYSIADMQLDRQQTTSNYSGQSVAI